MRGKLLKIICVLLMSLMLLQSVAFAAPAETDTVSETVEEQTTEETEQTPDDGEQTPDDGEQTPDDSEQTPGDGEQTPDDGEQTPDDGEQIPDDGEQTPDDGEQTPAEPEPLPAPELEFENIDINEIVLNWTEVEGAKKYEVLRRYFDNSTWSCIATVDADVLTYSDKKVTPGTYYFYRVRAVDENELQGVKSEAACVCARAAKPTGLKVVRRTSSSISISWEASKNADMYRIVRYEAGSAAVGGDWKGIKLTASTSYTDTKVELGKTYYYRVQAYNTLDGKNVFSYFSDRVQEKAAYTNGGKTAKDLVWPVKEPDACKATKASKRGHRHIDWYDYYGDDLKYTLFTSFGSFGSYYYSGSQKKYSSGRNRHHAGVDIGAYSSGTGFPLVACVDGIVFLKGYDSSQGNYVIIRGNDGYLYNYVHMKNPTTFKVKDKVFAGQVIGTMGNTGNSDRTHLHFEIMAPTAKVGKKKTDKMAAVEYYLRTYYNKEYILIDPTDYVCAAHERIAPLV